MKKLNQKELFNFCFQILKKNMKYLAKIFSKSPNILSIRAKKQVQKTYRKAKGNFSIWMFKCPCWGTLRSYTSCLTKYLILVIIQNIGMRVSFSKSKKQEQGLILIITEESVYQTVSEIFSILCCINTFRIKLKSSAAINNLRQGICNRVEKSSKAGQEKKSLVSIFACF